MTVRENNKANIILHDASGNKVNAEVTMKDDQVAPDFRKQLRDLLQLKIQHQEQYQRGEFLTLLQRKMAIVLER